MEKIDTTDHAFQPDERPPSEIRFPFATPIYLLHSKFMFSLFTPSFGMHKTDKGDSDLVLD